MLAKMHAMENVEDLIVARIWAADEKKIDYKTLGVDELLEQRIEGRRPRILRSLPQAKKLARRAMEVGYYKVLRVRAEAPGPIADDFDTLETRAKDAHDALRKLLTHLNPSAACADDLAISILTAQAGIQVGHPQKLHDQASREASALWEACEIVERLANAAPIKEGRVRKGRRNDGKPDHRVFAETLAEMWIFLTGEKPGSNPDQDKNPFLKFVAAAWVDAFGHAEDSEDPTFVGALASLSFNDEQISGLKSQGPYWI
jgi:hypothetical protein